MTTTTTTTTCRCAPVHARKFVSERDGIADGRTRVLVDAVLVEHYEQWCMSTYRCACGRMWAEQFWSRGQMDIYYVFPVPDGVDAKEWLTRSQGNPLEHDPVGPLGKP